MREVTQGDMAYLAFLLSAFIGLIVWVVLDLVKEVKALTERVKKLEDRK